MVANLFVIVIRNIRDILGFVHLEKISNVRAVSDVKSYLFSRTIKSQS